MAYKAAVFDLDGTLLNTIVDLAWATNYALEQFNMPTYTVDEVRQMVGNGVAKLIRDAAPEGTDDKTYQRVLACFKEHYADHSLDNTAPYPGILDAVDTLRAAGVKCAVVSNKPDFAIADLMSNFFPGRFDFALGQRDDLKESLMPSPSITLLLKLVLTLKTLSILETLRLMLQQHATVACLALVLPGDLGIKKRF